VLLLKLLLLLLLLLLKLLLLKAFRESSIADKESKML
jgi:hypothetical protein